MNAISFDHLEFPIITTQRLLLRPMNLQDAEALHDVRNMDDVMRYIARPRTKNIHEAEELIQRILNDIEQKKLLSWSICDRNNPAKLIGTIGFYRTQFENFRTEIGYLIHPSYWRQGYMTEAVMAMLQFGFDEIGFHSIEACIDPRNEGSRGVLLKCGFRKEAHYLENFFFENEFLDSEVYGLLKSEFKQRTT